MGDHNRLELDGMDLVIPFGKKAPPRKNISMYIYVYMSMPHKVIPRANYDKYTYILLCSMRAHSPSFDHDCCGKSNASANPFMPPPSSPPPRHSSSHPKNVHYFCTKKKTVTIFYSSKKRSLFLHRNPKVQYFLFTAKKCTNFART